MNPLVKGMLEATISNDVETRLLEDLFEHEVKCESKHDNWGDECSGEVTHLFRACVIAKRVCLTAANRIEGDMRGVCARCENSVSECWTIRPI